MNDEGKIEEINTAINKIRKSKVNGRYIINFYNE